MEARLAYEFENGTKVKAVCCSCAMCKSLFMVPAGDVYEDPKFCPFCGVKFIKPPIIDGHFVEQQAAQCLDSAE